MTKRELNRIQKQRGLLCALVALSLWLVASLAVLAAPAPYAPDANTVFLFHLDEPPGASVATNSATLTAGTNLISFDGNPYAGDSTDQSPVTTVLGATGYTGFGNCADVSAGTDLGLGLDANLSGAFRIDDGAPVSNDRLPTHMFFGAGNAFTLEALVNVSAITGSSQEIISTDQGSSASTDRGLQFRINTSGQLEFNFVGVLTTSVTATIPTSGPHAFVAGQWFHAAVVYDGSNALFYWTRLDAATTNANLIGGPLAEGVDINDDMLLVIGNEGRAVGVTGSTEGLLGLIDEVRISNVARAATNFYWLPTAPTDSDGDGLADSWETNYFGNLSQGATNDFDLDTFNNLAEYTAGSNPTNALSTPNDLDADGLPDAWEITNFGNVNQSASGDPDRDGFSNLVEYQNGSDPNNPNSVPGDTDGDSLPDAWEVANLGGLTYWAYEDPDNDGYNNVAEMMAGTDPLNTASHPNWKSPRVALMRDSVVTTNACLMPSPGTYGRAINGISFQTRILFALDGYQYTAWYDTVGTTQSIWMARRTVTNTSVGAWEKFQTDSQLTNGDEGVWDAHNVISLGVSPVDGTLHFSWDMHGNTLRYRHSVLGLCTTNKAAWGAGMLAAEQSWLVASGQTISTVTYPMFINTPSGDLMFEYRTGNTTAGDHWLHKYKPATTNWTTGWKFEAKEGTYTGVLASGSTGTSTSRNAYENNFDFAPDGTLHHTWTYRELADSSNHDINYAYSTNGGVTWRNNAGTVIADTNTSTYINVNSPGTIMKVLDSRQRLINQQGQCVDNDGRVHVLMLHRRVEPDAAWISGDSTFSVMDTAYYHYFRDPATGVWSQRRIPFAGNPVGTRPKIGFDAAGNVYATFLSYASTNSDVVPGYIAGKLVLATASKASQYTDWEVVQSLATDLNGEPLIDQARLLADNILSIFIQENSTTATAVGTPLHVFDFATGVKAPNPLSINFLGPDSLVVFTATAGHTYQLQSASTLAPANWSYVGAVVTGVNGPMALPDPNGRSATQRFYRIIQDP